MYSKLLSLSYLVYMTVAATTNTTNTTKTTNTTNTTTTLAWSVPDCASGEIGAQVTKLLIYKSYPFLVPIVAKLSLSPCLAG